MTTTISALLPLWPNGPEVEVQIDFYYASGSPASGPTLSHPGDPAEPPEVSLFQAQLIIPQGCDGSIINSAKLQDLAADYLASDDGYLTACEAAAEDKESQL